MIWLMAFLAWPALAVVGAEALHRTGYAALLIGVVGIGYRIWWVSRQHHRRERSPAPRVQLCSGCNEPVRACICDNGWEGP